MYSLARRNRRYRTLHAVLNGPLTVVLGPELSEILSQSPRKVLHEGVSEERARETPREWVVGVKYISCPLLIFFLYILNFKLFSRRQIDDTILFKPIYNPDRKS